MLTAAQWLAKLFSISTAVVITAVIAIAFSPQDKVFHYYVIALWGYFVLAGLRMLFYATYAAKQANHLDSLKPLPRAKNPKVSIIVPAYNEEKVIARTLENLSQVKYSNFEIIVVDDGSQDATYDVVIETAKKLLAPIRVYKKQNQGKSLALNYGIDKACGEFILCVDADSRIHPRSIHYGLLHMADQKVAAVAGHVEVANQMNLLGQFQELEYLIGNFQRKALANFGMVSIVPGPIGLFRKKAILAVGGYDKEGRVFAEDTELSLRLLAQGWKTVMDDRMISYTEAPEDLMSLFRQRYRWVRGTYQAIIANLLGLSEHSPKTRGLLGLMLIEQTLLPLLEMGFFLLFLIHYVFLGSVDLLTVWMGLVIVFELMMVGIATARFGGLSKWTVVYLFARQSFAPVMLVWKMLSLFDEWSDKQMSWDKLDRTGNSMASREIV